jgi:hypothetical protein
MQHCRVRRTAAAVSIERSGLLLPTGLHMQSAEATVTVGLEWPHIQRLGQGEGLAV